MAAFRQAWVVRQAHEGTNFVNTTSNLTAAHSGAHARQQGDSAHDAKGVQARQYYEAHEVTYNKHLKAALADLKIVVQNPCKGAQDIAPEIMRSDKEELKEGLKAKFAKLQVKAKLMQDFASIATVALNQREAELLEMSQALVDQRKEVQAAAEATAAEMNAVKSQLAAKDGTIEALNAEMVLLKEQLVKAQAAALVCTDASSVHDAGVAPAPIQEKQQQQCISDPLKSLKLKQMLGLACSDASSACDAFVEPAPASIKAQQQAAECSNATLTLKMKQLIKMAPAPASPTAVQAPATPMIGAAAGGNWLGDMPPNAVGVWKLEAQQAANTSVVRSDGYGVAYSSRTGSSGGRSNIGSGGSRRSSWGSRSGRHSNGGHSVQGPAVMYAGYDSSGSGGSSMGPVPQPGAVNSWAAGGMSYRQAVVSRCSW